MHVQSTWSELTQAPGEHTNLTDSRRNPISQRVRTRNPLALEGPVLSTVHQVTEVMLLLFLNLFFKINNIMIQKFKIYICELKRIMTFYIKPYKPVKLYSSHQAEIKNLKR